MSAAGVARLEPADLDRLQVLAGTYAAWWSAPLCVTTILERHAALEALFGWAEEFGLAQRQAVFQLRGSHERTG